MRTKFNDKKRIGKVLFLVEGDVDETNIVKHVFYDVLGYSVSIYDKRSNNVTTYKSEKDKFSMVYVVPMEFPAIKKILTSEDYIDAIYYKLKERGLRTDNCFTYFLFDRDRESNKYGDVKEALLRLKNSQDNEENISGMLLLSYPCSQAYICNCYKDFCYIPNAKELKEYSHKYPLSKIRLDNVKDGSLVMADIIKSMTGLEISETDLFDISNININVLKSETNLYRDKNTFKVLSLFSICLLDLGILEIVD